MNPPSQATGARSSVSGDEISHFDDLARQWWDEDGDFKALHRINPARMHYILDRLRRHFGIAAGGRTPLTGLAIIDIGCGGGLITEPLARLGAEVTGIDASSDSIEIARRHAGTSGLSVTYVNAPPESLAEGEQVYDAVISMEVIEHTVDAGLFIEASVRLIRPGGLFIGATLNRTLKSLVLGKIAAEYVLGWVPPGTHDWRKFVRPSEFAAYLRRAGLEVSDFTGISYAPLEGDWTLSKDLGVNYMLAAAKPGGE
ncbi:MAG: bifunctional 2-polyprenyl-6-hydroxyphenol methylase/3-demethylubiquinol 3-O-methyltransferase UbiG [Rhodospirillales bacterium]|jgi:2-polyprenyl-6-hydroxyphenyl methylase/3-demethylubiquinone-9 3-methyltransferase